MNTASTYSNPQVYDCFHFYSDGRSQFSLFQDDSEKIIANNLMAAFSYADNVGILCFSLMDTHFHIVLHGQKIKCENFSRDFIRNYLGTVNKLRLRKQRIDAPPANLEKFSDERSLRNLIVYVYRNCINAGFPNNPWHYYGGPGDIYFTPDKRMESGRKIFELNSVEKKNLLHTHQTLPEDWEIDQNGKILSKCFVDWQFVNNLFGGPRIWLAFMHQKKDIESEIGQKLNISRIQACSDKEVRDYFNDVSKNLYNKPLSQCSAIERAELARKIWSSNSRFGINQIARAVQLDTDLIRSMFNRL